MNLADNDKLIQYVFPEGPLPVITQVKHAILSSSVFVLYSFKAHFQCCLLLISESPLLAMCLQIYLKTEAGQKELNKWPQYQGCLVPAYGGKRIQLKTLQYFLLWTAFYVLRSAHTSSSDVMGPRPPQTTTRLGHFKQVRCNSFCCSTVCAVLCLVPLLIVVSLSVVRHADFLCHILKRSIMVITL